MPSWKSDHQTLPTPTGCLEPMLRRGLTSRDSIFPELPKQLLPAAAGSAVGKLVTTGRAGHNLGGWTELGELVSPGPAHQSCPSPQWNPGRGTSKKYPSATSAAREGATRRLDASSAMGLAPRDSRHDIRIMGPVRFKIYEAPLGSPLLSGRASSALHSADLYSTIHYSKTLHSVALD